jgi:hypothetical protein
MSPPRIKPTSAELERFRAHLARDPESPSKLVWRERPRSFFKRESDWASWTAKWAWKPAGTLQDGAWRIAIDRANGRKFKVQDVYNALAAMGDETLRPDAIAVDEGSGGTLADILESARRDLGMTLGDLTVLSGWNDPYRVATPGRMRDAEWFAEHWTGSDARHLRGFHYTLIGNATKPDGAPYTGANKDGRWLKGASAAARWLGLVPFDALDDRRASDPAIYRAERTETALSAGVGATFDAEPPLIEVTEGDTGEINIYPALSGMEAEQPYILAIFGEKSSLASEALPVAPECAADVYLETGEQSITHAYHLAERAAADGRPLALFCITDCDPSGHQMTISIARKMQALRDLQFPTLDVDVIHVGLTPDQMREFGLPSSPLSDNEKRAGRWTELMGVEQTEVDSLLALHPGALAQMLRDAIEPYFDPTLDERVSAAGPAWRGEAGAAINEAIGGDPDLAARLAEIEARAEDIRQKIEALDAETSRTPSKPSEPTPRAMTSGARPPPSTSTWRRLRARSISTRRTCQKRTFPTVRPTGRIWCFRRRGTGSRRRGG